MFVMFGLGSAQPQFWFQNASSPTRIAIGIRRRNPRKACPSRPRSRRDTTLLCRQVSTFRRNAGMTILPIFLACILQPSLFLSA